MSGEEQIGTPHMDGVPGVTQCPISPGATFVYKWEAKGQRSSWFFGKKSIYLGKSELSKSLAFNHHNSWTPIWYVNHNFVASKNHSCFTQRRLVQCFGTRTANISVEMVPLEAILYVRLATLTTIVTSTMRIRQDTSYLCKNITMRWAIMYC